MRMDLSELHDWLEQQYRVIDLQLTSQPSGNNNPLWVVGGDKAQLLDPQLGLWMLFHPVETDAAAASSVEDAIQESLDHVSRLDPRSSVGEEHADKRGPWQVHVVWLVAKEARDAWEAALADLRARSGHAEEVGMDAVVVSGGGLRKALDDQGLPALLLHTRALLKLAPEALPNWLSPDYEFETEFRRIPPSLASQEDRQHAQAFVDEVIALHHKTTQPASGETAVVPALGLLEIHDVRNIVRAQVELTGSGADGLHVSVYHGPNGTGKSSLFEALSLALFGGSLRLREFLEDKDIKPGDRSRYGELALRRFDAERPPTIKLSGVNRLNSIASSEEQARGCLARASGTLLAQETAREFVTLPAAERGAQMLGDYSRLADLAQQELNRHHEQAKASWQATLRELGLNASITKKETIYKRLAQRLIDEKVPSGSDSADHWLKMLCALRPDYRAEAEILALRWLRIDSSAARADLAERFDIGVLAGGLGRETLTSWLDSRQAACQDIVAIEAKAAPYIDSIRAQWERVRGDLASWATWSIERRRRQSNAARVGDAPQAPPPSAEPIAGDAERAVEEELRRLEATGKLARSQLEHLQALRKEFLPGWAAKHPHDCPTCGQKHPQQIEEIVARLVTECESQLQSTRQAYKEQDAKLKAQRLKRAAADRPPISPERQAEIAAMLALPVDGLDSLSSRMENQPQAWEDLLRPLRALIAGPMLPNLMDATKQESLASEFIAALDKAVAMTERQRTAPDRWAQLKKCVDDCAVKVLKEHLPKTIEAVWRELALALGPARWNQPGQATMKLDQQRGEAKLALILHRDNSEPGLPVRHVLNQAEQHVVGLAWFFTRHLTHGRHLTPLIALDDPAQEMDQKTFRQFCRFLQAICRLHRSTAQRLTLIAFLHQEDRALELARAVQPDARLTLLSWVRAMRLNGPDANAREIRLRNPEQRAPMPLPLREPQQKAAASA